MHYMKYATASLKSIHVNTKHRFAQQHALNLYRKDALYSFIPKNACSTMRLSVAMANGFIKNKRDYNWIHQNNGTFSAELRDLVRCQYAFVILRDPFSRLVSAYLDKIVGRDLDLWSYVDLHDRSIKPEAVTFEFFVRSLLDTDIRDGNIHWRPQQDFLVFDNYDDYFSIENLSSASRTLKEKIDLKVVDARPLTAHQTSGYKPLKEESPFSLSPIKLFEMKNAGYLPRPKDMFNVELIEIVAEVYSGDIALYKQKITDAKSPLYKKLLKQK